MVENGIYCTLMIDFLKHIQLLKQKTSDKTQKCY